MQVERKTCRDEDRTGTLVAPWVRVSLTSMMRTSDASEVTSTVPTTGPSLTSFPPSHSSIDENKPKFHGLKE
jgi:hypothetical protein